MFDLDLWREIFQSINKNRTRTVLSGFTVAFAILLFAILFGMANGLSNTFSKAFVDDANNAIFIYTGTTSKAYKGYQAGRQIQLKNEDLDYVKETYGDKIQYYTGRVTRNVNASFENEKNSYGMRAVHPDHQYLENTKITEGRYINKIDIENKTKVIVIGRLVEEDLFAKTTAMGKYLNLDGIQYKVVGIFKDDGGDNEERMIYTPISTTQRLYGNNDYLDQINVTYNPKMSYDEAIDFGNQITKDLKERFSVDPTDQRAIRIMNMAQANKGTNQITFALSVIIIIIGFGTLIAGIVGISNIMIFVVKERTKEIGIRKALGAPPKAIISIILLESILITTIAGYFGLVLGMGILDWIGPSLETYFITDPKVSTSLVVTATITLIVAGSIAGYFPAKKASKIKPIVALRDN